MDANTSVEMIAAQARLDAFDAVEVVDDAGMSLPPEEATSLRMAFAAGLVDGAASSADSGADDAAFQQLHADAMTQAHAMFERFGGAAAFAARITSTDFAASSDDDDASDERTDAPVDAGVAEVDEYGECNEADDEGMGMEGAEYSRAHSDVGDDGEWVLERILNHRMGRNRGECSFDWDSAGAPSGSATRVREYQCKWRGYTEATWETAAALDRLGCGDEVAAYERIIRQRVSDALALSRHGPALQKYCPRSKLVLAKQRELLRSLFPFSGRIADNIAKDLYQTGHCVTDVAFVAPAARTMEFFHHWGGNIEKIAPAIVYHGTREANVPGICAHGLLAPGVGNDVRTVHGAAYGVGVYTASDASTSVPYMCPAGFMFICAGLVGRRFTTTRTGGSHMAGRGTVPHGFVIFQMSSHVVPLWLVRIGMRGAGPPVVHPTVDAMLARFGLTPVDPATAAAAHGAAGTSAQATCPKAPVAAPAAAMDERAAQARADEIMHKHYRQAPPKMQRKLRYSLQQLVLNGSVK
jgi:hypothetical protein